MAIKLSLNKTLYSYDGQLEAYVTDTTVVKVQIYTDYNLSDSVLVYQQGDVKDSVAIINNVAEIPGMNLRSGQLSVAVLYDNTLSNFVQIYATKAAALSQNLVDDDPYFTVDRNKRLVSVPGTQDMLAVNFDENSEVITFKFPRYADGVDLSTKEIYVNYERSDKTRNKALCTLTDTSDSYVVFTWVVSAYATQVEGTLSFNIEFRSVDYRWQTQPTSLLVYRSLLYTGEAVPDQPELLDQYLARFAELNSHPPIPGDDGYWRIWSLDTHSYETSEFPLQADKDGKSAYQYAVEGGYTGTKEEFAAKLAAEIPTTLPNPNALTFTGAVTGRYDGSNPVEIKIPDSGKYFVETESGTHTEIVKTDHLSTSINTDGSVYNGTGYKNNTTISNYAEEESTKYSVSGYIKVDRASRYYIEGIKIPNIALINAGKDYGKIFVYYKDFKPGLGNYTLWTDSNFNAINAEFDDDGWLKSFSLTNIHPEGGDSFYIRISAIGIDSNSMVYTMEEAEVKTDGGIALSPDVRVNMETTETMNYNTIVEQAVGNAYINHDGALEATNSWCVSEYIRVDPSYTIDYLLYGTASTSLIAFYDGNRDYISSIYAETSGLHNGVKVIPPDGAYYLRFSVLIGRDVQYVTLTKRRIDSLEAELERLKAENPLTGKILTATGDSITATASNRQYGSYARMIAAKNGMEYESKAIWGATLAKGVSGSSGCILETIETMREDADYIILSGGANDFYHVSNGNEQLGSVSGGYTAALDETTFCGAIESLCKKSIEKWPGKKVLYVITHRMTDISDQTALQTHVETLREILVKWGIPYVDLWHEMPSLMLPALKDRYTSNGNTVYEGTGDGLHPNEDGYRLYYVPRVEAKMKAI